MLKQPANVLFLVPVPISETDINWSVPLNSIHQIIKIQCFIVENAKTARHYLKQINPQIKYDEILIYELNKHDINSQIAEIKDLLAHHTMIGLMSEAGLPCIADPGNHVVRLAHDLHLTVKPLIGPSSIILALISSGFNGQQFKFHGYLPAKPEEKRTAVLNLEKEAIKATQLFIEAPYRNDKMLSDLIQILYPATRLLVAIDMTGEKEKIICQTIAWWKKNPLEIGKIPCLFGVGI